ncbi:putative RNA recognition motif domain, nucleotide-binding alpha-beta plait domain superfamily [Helianthus debilis subsp. tardiflorus]
MLWFVNFESTEDAAKAVEGLNGQKFDESTIDLYTNEVIRDPNGTSKGSFFVAFSASDEASRALMEMNGKMIAGKPLYVALAQRKEVRRARLQFMMVDFARTNGALVSKYWKDNVTHEIAATDANGAFTRTLKVLMAILNRKWVVTMECTAFNLSGRSYDFTSPN